MYNVDEQAAARQPSSAGQLRQWVADRLRAEILDRRIVAGEWLRQERIARELGVSQTPVREALKQLAAEGVVEFVPYRGIRVISFTPEDVEDMYAVRMAEEGRAAHFAALNIQPDELEELRRIHAAMSVCVTPAELAQYRELNRRFHLLIIEASRRPYLVRSLGRLWAAFPTMLWGSLPGVARDSAPGRDDPDTAEHEELLDALAAKDGPRAERAMAQHIASACEALTAAMRRDAP